jgi:hypothetical protein
MKKYYIQVLNGVCSMKRAVFLAVLFAFLTAVIFAQSAELPRLAVVEFSPNPSNEKTRTMRVLDVFTRTIWAF